MRRTAGRWELHLPPQVSRESERLVHGYLGTFRAAWTSLCDQRIMEGERVIVCLLVTFLSPVRAMSGDLVDDVRADFAPPVFEETKIHPSVRIHATVTEILPGDSLDLTCSTTGFPPPTVTWYDEQREITDYSFINATTRSVTLTDVTESAVYTCRASNDVGTVESSTRVQITECGSDLSADIVVAAVPTSRSDVITRALALIHNVSREVDEQYNTSRLRVSLVPTTCPHFDSINSAVFTNKLDILEKIDLLENSDVLLTQTVQSMYRVSFPAVVDEGGEAERRVGILLVENTWYDTKDAVWEASLARFLHGVQLFVIGVGSDVDMDALHKMASFPVEQHAFHVDNYSQLHEVTRKIVRGICLRRNVPGGSVPGGNDARPQ